MGGTWSTNGAVEPHGDEAPASGEAEGSFTAHGPDRDKLCHGGCQELRICSGQHLHYFGSIGT